MADVTVKQQTQDVCYPGKGGPFNAYLATPEGSGPFPVVIVVQEWWGLNEHIKDITRLLAGEGYFAVAPDLYSRQGHRVTDDPNVAAELMEGLKPNQGIDDLFSTIGWIKKQSAAKATHIGIVGFCLGGSYAALLTCCSRDLKAAAPFYGEIPDDDKLHQLSCPLWYVYGSNDGWIQRADVDRLAKALRTFNKPGEVRVYEGRSQGFFNDTRADVYHAADAQDAWSRTLPLFEENLKH